jgi:hypothetical protein
MLAVAALVYQGWLVWRRPPRRRTKGMLAILWGSMGVSALVLIVWVSLSLRYR